MDRAGQCQPVSLSRHSFRAFQRGSQSLSAARRCRAVHRAAGLALLAVASLACASSAALVSGRAPFTGLRGAAAPAPSVSLFATDKYFAALGALASPASDSVADGRAQVVADGRAQVVALDTEFVGVGRNTPGFRGSENALARISIVAANKEVLLDTTVRVPRKVVDFRLDISGLTQDSIDSGIEFEQARDWAAHLLHGRTVVGHNLDADWKVLNLTHPPKLIRDTSKYKPLRARRPYKRMPKLSVLARDWLGIDMQTGFHDSVEDASVALDLYLLKREEWEEEVGSLASRPPAPSLSPAPRGAATLLTRTLQEATEVMRDRQGGANAMLAYLFATAAQGSTTKWASLHFDRVARTFAYLPYKVTHEGDLQRPELACIGKAGSKSYKMALSAIATFQKAAKKASEGKVADFPASGGMVTKKEKKEGKAKAAKDPNAPKRPLSSYLHFCVDHRAEVVEAMPGGAFTAITKELAARWKKLAAKDKTKYVDMAERAKSQYAKDVARYQAELVEG